MKTLLVNNLQKEKAPRVGMALGLLLLLFLLAGCESPSGAPGSRPGGSAAGRPGGASVPGRPGGAFTPGAGRGVVSKSPMDAKSANNAAVPSATIPAVAEKSAETQKTPTPAGVINPLAPVVRVEQAGNPVELASSIIVAKANPFLDWLPKPLQVETVPVVAGESAPASIPADPFENVVIQGVIDHPKTPMVLLGGGEKTQLLGKGGILDLGLAQAKVLAIRTNSVDLQLLDGSLQIRTFELPDIIGYQPAGGGTASRTEGATGNNALVGPGNLPTANAMPNASPPSAVQGNRPPATGPSTALGNLQRLARQPLGPASNNPASGPQANLQEPLKGNP